MLLDNSVPAASIPAIKEAVTNAAGIQTKRGDTISIGQIAFAKPHRRPPAAASSPLGYAKYALLAIAAPLFLFFTTRSLRKREKEPIDEPAWLRELEAPMRLAELEREIPTRPTECDVGLATAWQRQRRQRRRDIRRRSSSSPTATRNASPSSCAAGCRRTSAMASELPPALRPANCVAGSQAAATAARQRARARPRC